MQLSGQIIQFLRIIFPEQLLFCKEFTDTLSPCFRLQLLRQIPQFFPCMNTAALCLRIRLYGIRAVNPFQDSRLPVALLADQHGLLAGIQHKAEFLHNSSQIFFMCHCQLFYLQHNPSSPFLSASFGPLPHPTAYYRPERSPVSSSFFQPLEGRITACSPTTSLRIRSSTCCLCLKCITRSSKPEQPRSLP